MYNIPLSLALRAQMGDEEAIKKVEWLLLNTPRDMVQLVFSDEDKPQQEDGSVEL